MVKFALLARMEAKPDQEQALADFLAAALPMAESASYDIAWFAVRFGPRSFGIFDVFHDEAGRQAHLDGPIAHALFARAEELLSGPPVIERADIIGAKLPG